MASAYVLADTADKATKMSKVLIIIIMVMSVMMIIDIIRRKTQPLGKLPLLLLTLWCGKLSLQ